MKHIEDIRSLVKTLQQSTKFHALIVQSPPGWAKSSTIDLVLNELTVTYRAVGSYTTPLALYNALGESPDHTLVLDDCAGLFGDVIAMAVLKAATWPASGTGGERKVVWNTTSDRARQPSITFNGKLILLTNTIPLGPHTEALLSRALYLSVAFSRDQVAEMLLEGAKSPGYFEEPSLAWKVALYLASQLSSYDFRRINLRTLQMGCEIAKANADTWQDLLERLLPGVGPKTLVEQLSSSQWPVETQIREFTRLTGLSRRTFYNYRQFAVTNNSETDMQRVQPQVAAPPTVAQESA